MNIKQRILEIKNKTPAIYLALKRKDTPLVAKILAGITVGYALSPIDFIPDFIPILGYLDDIIILPLLAALTIKLIPKNIMQECKTEALNMWADGKPYKWYYAAPILTIWIIILLIILIKLYF